MDSKEAADRRRGLDAPSTQHLDAESVEAYLRLHPDFLLDHPALLPVLTPPSHHRGDGVIDMQSFMLHRLRDELARLKTQQRTLLTTSRSNMTSQNRVHAAVLALIGARSFELVIQTVTTDLAILLDVDVVTLCIESEAGSHVKPPLNGVQLMAPGEVDRLLGPGRDALLEDHVLGDPTIFGSGAGLVRSEALLRLAVGRHAPVGLLALGSRKPTKFRAGQGTELLGFLARSLEHTIAAWLDIEP
ncbi:MAG TPA: DUF484 family protein [Stellaceae bacterium]|nr:DUF484 family protein [Stellaceae bacterium]